MSLLGFFKSFITRLPPEEDGDDYDGEEFLFTLVFHMNGDPSSIVHDLHGDFTLEPGESIEDAPYMIIQQYVDENGFRNAFPVQILRFNYTY